MACWRFFRLLIVLTTGLLITSQGAAGLNPAKAITQYAHESWHTIDGLPQDNILSVVQTPDGYLWLGTEEGLARFDGVRFTIFDKSNTPELKSSLISALLVDRKGNLWIGTGGGGVNRFKGGKFTVYNSKVGLADDAVYSISPSQDGSVWLGTAAG